jgi:hypothetical protein
MLRCALNRASHSASWHSPEQSRQLEKGLQCRLDGVSVSEPDDQSRVPSSTWIIWLLWTAASVRVRSLRGSSRQPSRSLDPSTRWSTMRASSSQNPFRTTQRKTSRRYPRNPKDFLKTLSPMGTISDVKGIVEAVVYLTEAGQVTGEALHVDGGAHSGKW